MQPEAGIRELCMSCSKLVLRCVESVLVAVMLLIAVPIGVGISLLILLSSGWPILYSQTRIGLGKKPFTIYKFRTMWPHASAYQDKIRHLNEAPEPMFKIHDDPRFTPLGKWLSSTGLDELPQLYNIIKGDMAVVGPRPLPVSEARQLPTTWDFRYAIKPGVISHWAVLKNRHSSLEQWRSMDQKTVSLATHIPSYLRLVGISAVVCLRGVANSASNLMRNT